MRMGVLTFHSVFHSILFHLTLSLCLFSSQSEAGFEEQVLTFGVDEGVGQSTVFKFPSPLQENSFDLLDSEVAQISAGERFSAVITKNGRAFMWGNNKWGQLGRGFYSFSGSSMERLSLPVRVDTSQLDNPDTRFSQVSAGIRHSLLLDTNNQLYAVGNCLSGEETPTAIEDTLLQRIQLPQSIQTGQETIIQISTGACSSFLLTDMGNVYSFGISVLPGQLGRPGLETIPAPVAIPEPVVQISTGRFHTLYLTDSGQVYISGRNEWGQLGDEDLDMVQETPRLLNLPSSIDQVEAGQFHSLFLTNDSKIFFLGLWKEQVQMEGKRGFLSTAITSLREIDQSYVEGTVVKMSAGFVHSLFLTENGTVYSIGGGCIAPTRGREGCSEILLPIFETFNENITQIDAGSFHSIILTNGSLSKNSTVDFPLCPIFEDCFEFVPFSDNPVETTTPPDDNEPEEPRDEKGNETDLALILGIVAAVLALALIIGGTIAGFYAWKWRENQKERLRAPDFKEMRSLSVEEEISLSQQAARTSNMTTDDPVYENFEKATDNLSQNKKEEEGFYDIQTEEESPYQNQ